LALIVGRALGLPVGEAAEPLTARAAALPRLGRRSAPDVGGRIVAAALASVDREIPRFDDVMLPVLVEQALRDPVPDVRLYAAMLLAATPYRDAVADATVTELGRPAVLGDPVLGPRLLECLRVTGVQRHRECP